MSEYSQSQIKAIHKTLLAKGMSHDEAIRYMRNKMIIPEEKTEDIPEWMEF